jgi:hypothetical protein
MSKALLAEITRRAILSRAPLTEHVNRAKWRRALRRLAVAKSVEFNPRK